MNCCPGVERAAAVGHTHDASAGSRTARLPAAVPTSMLQMLSLLRVARSWRAPSLIWFHVCFKLSAQGTRLHAVRPLHFAILFLSRVDNVNHVHFAGLLMPSSRYKSMICSTASPDFGRATKRSVDNLGVEPFRFASQVLYKHKGRLKHLVWTTKFGSR